MIEFTITSPIDDPEDREKLAGALMALLPEQITRSHAVYRRDVEEDHWNVKYYNIKSLVGCPTLEFSAAEATGQYPPFADSANLPVAIPLKDALEMAWVWVKTVRPDQPSPDTDGDVELGVKIWGDDMGRLYFQPHWIVHGK